MHAVVQGLNAVSVVILYDMYDVAGVNFCNTLKCNNKELSDLTTC